MFNIHIINMSKCGEAKLLASHFYEGIKHVYTLIHTYKKKKIKSFSFCRTFHFFKVYFKYLNAECSTEQ